MTPAEALDRCKATGRLSADGWMLLTPTSFFVDGRELDGIISILLNIHTKEWNASLIQMDDDTFLSQSLLNDNARCAVMIEGIESHWYGGHAFCVRYPQKCIGGQSMDFVGDGPLTPVPACT